MGLAGCSAAPPSGQTPTTGPVSTNSTATSTSSASEEAGQVKSVERLSSWSWKVLRKNVPNGWTETFAYDGRYLVESAKEDGRTIKVMDQRSGEVLVRHDTVSSANWRVQSAFLEQPWLVVVEGPIDGESRSPATHAFVYDLRNGSRTDMSARGVPTPANPGMYDVDSHAVAYTTRSRGRSCLAVVQLKSLTSRTVGCAKSHDLIGRPSLSGDRLTGVIRATTGKPCAHAVTFDLGQAKPAGIILPEAKRCSNFGAAGGPDFNVAIEIPIGAEDLTQGLIYGHSGGGEPQPLGAAESATAIICGPWAYWETVDNPKQQVEVRRWQPGSDIETIYRTPIEGWFVTSALQCDGNWLHFSRAWTGGGRERGVQLLVADTQP
jgi:hypothetical protein